MCPCSCSTVCARRSRNERGTCKSELLRRRSFVRLPTWTHYAFCRDFWEVQVIALTWRMYLLVIYECDDECTCRMCG